MSVPNNTPTASEQASARSFLWRFLAAAFSPPDEEIWEWLRAVNTELTLVRAVTVATRDGGRASQVLLLATRDVIPALPIKTDLAEAESAYHRLFGHTVRGDCPPHEIEYGELRADALFQPHRLADIGAFYRAFGLELVPEAAERVDHVAMECEFYSVLCGKEAHAQERAQDALEIIRGAQKKFLREHLGRWTPAFTRRAQRLSVSPFYAATAALLRASVTAECERLAIPMGNEDLPLRPAEEQVDPCGACGLAEAAFPGAERRE